MTNTMLIAQILLPVSALATISMFINAKWFKRALADMKEHPALMLLVAMINLIGGTLILMYHNTRTADLSVVITLIGWIALLRGAVIMLIPKSIGEAMTWVAKKNIVYVAAVICAIVTIILFSLCGWNG